MLQAQGVRPLDPYRTLQLHPLAPRELIVDVYWALIERAKQSPASSSETSDRIRDLNAAYSLLMDEARRRAYDEGNGLAALNPPRIHMKRRRLGLPFLSDLRLVSDHSDYYQLLRVDTEADAHVVHIAYSFMARKAAGPTSENVFLRGLLDDAYRTLSNPHLRAQYDESLQARKKTAAPKQRPPMRLEPRGVGPEPPHLPVHFDERRAPAVAAGRPENRARPVSAPEPAHHAQVPEPPAARGDETPATQAPDKAHASGAMSPAPVDEATAWAEPKRLSLLKRLRPAGEPRQSVNDQGDAPKPADARPKKLSESERVREAEQARLLSLREILPNERPERPARIAPSSRTQDLESAVAELIFVAGPQTGERVPVGERTLVIGGQGYDADVVLRDPQFDDVPEQGRIWRHADRFMFRQTWGGHTIINGEALSLPLVFLEDGDELEIGAHRIRFAYLRHAVPAEGTGA